MNIQNLPQADPKVLAIAEIMIKKLAAEKVFLPLGEDVKSLGTPLVMVHPFYYGDEEDRGSYYNIFSDEDNLQSILNENYLENMKKFLSSFQGNIYLYESNLRFQTTKRILNATRKFLDGVYFFETAKDSSISTRLIADCQDAVYLSGLSSKFLFAGGRVVKYCSDKKMVGCLGGLVSHFNTFGISGEFVKGCCFI